MLKLLAICCLLTACYSLKINHDFMMIIPLPLTPPGMFMPPGIMPPPFFPFPEMPQEELQAYNVSNLSQQQKTVDSFIRNETDVGKANLTKAQGDGKIFKYTYENITGNTTENWIITAIKNSNYHPKANTTTTNSTQPSVIDSNSNATGEDTSSFDENQDFNDYEDSEEEEEEEEPTGPYSVIGYLYTSFEKRGNSTQNQNQNQNQNQTQIQNGKRGDMGGYGNNGLQNGYSQYNNPNSYNGLNDDENGQPDFNDMLADLFNSVFNIGF